MTDGTGSFGPSPLERIIIIGGAGFIGSHFTDRLMADVGTEQVTLFDNFSSGREEFFAHHQDDARLDSGFLVLYGDSYLNIDVAALWAASGDGARPVMSVLRNQGRWDASNAVYADGMVTLFEKGRADAAGATSDGGMEFIDYGISVLNADVIREHVPAASPRPGCRSTPPPARCMGMRRPSDFMRSAHPRASPIWKPTWRAARLLKRWRQQYWCA